MRLRIAVITICAVVMMDGSAYSQVLDLTKMVLWPGPCRIIKNTYALKSYEDVKKHILLIENGESDTPFITEGVRDGKIVSLDPGDPVIIIEEMDFRGKKIWMFNGGSKGATLYSWKRLAFECYNQTKIDDKFINAAYEGKLEEVKFFFNLGANINAKNSIGQTALRLASMYNHSEVVAFLKANGGKSGGNPVINGKFRIAADDGNLAEIKRLLSEGADINAQAQDGYTALMSVSFDGRLEVVKLLLDEGADVNAKTDGGITALQEATRKGHLEVVKILKAHGAKN